MATRRPKVPRVTPAARHTDPGAAGGDVIQADFGSRRPAEAGTGTGGESGAGTGTKSGAKSGVRGAGGAESAREKSPAEDAPKNNRGPSGSSTVPGAGETLDPIPAKAFSGRMLALAVVMIAITIMLAPTVKIFIDKRAEIAALEADIAASKSAQDDLKRQVSRWQDPNYVKQQARDRINMVMPGETGYWVFGSDLPAGASGGQPGAAAQDPANLPWVDSLWESIRRSATD
ncbi:septum formation initiator family protein [Arthrobacter sp. ISL-28]|uniref:FtsB family cell division protein n=1 Tax=Arthrobacter sp. ISL-28 TaxID=2819108 RepID=UPI001BE9C79C|nr:septum formation initiator family protein [Arthrobacter sp. ISL-28]MBT2520406.1 septum formation initiator family protein [Arthrobacter sp. ISL-28]